MDGMIEAVKNGEDVISISSLPAIRQRITSRNTRLIKHHIINPEQVQNGLPPPMMRNRNDEFNYYCQYCWQRYYKASKPSVSLCVKNQALLGTMVNLFHQ